jgi:dTDP-4-dehydrorhamnose reductase
MAIRKKEILKARKKTILIFGISSFVGSNLAEFFSKDYRVIGTYHRNPTFLPGVLSVPCDVLDRDSVQLVLFAFKPDITIYCVGLSSLTLCAQHEELADALNTSGLFNVTEFCARYKSQIVYLSSSYVFAGDDKSYLEMDLPNAITSYGKTLASSEFYIQKTSLNYTIFRCCHFYGRCNAEIRTTYFETLQKSLFNREKVMCDGYIQTGFLDIQYLGMVMKMSFDKGSTNRLLQVSSQDIMSHHDFAKKYCEIFGGNGDLVNKVKWPFPLHGSVTDDVADHLLFSMDISNIEGFLNIELPSIEESLAYTYQRLGGVDQSKKGKAKTASINYI